MIASLIIRKQRRQLQQLERELVDARAAIDRDKQHFKRAAGQQMTSPYAIAACFAAGCVAELVLEKGHVPSVRWVYRAGMMAAQL